MCGVFIIEVSDGIGDAMDASSHFTYVQGGCQPMFLRTLAGGGDCVIRAVIQG
jgi:hypothetical protein